MEEYVVDKTDNLIPVTVEVPGSKSVTNRALMLAALSDGVCRLSGVLFSDDSRAFLDCLEKLGFALEIDEGKKIVSVTGMGGVIPNPKAEINVRSAGTAARFLTVMLAFAGGEYTLRSSEQMEKRPMEPLLTELRRAGAEIICLKNEGCFPFVLRSDGITASKVSIDTEVSSQFASAILMSATLCKGGLTVKLTGNRTEGAYVKITAEMLKQFGVRYEKNGADYFVYGEQKYRLKEYEIEPDFSAAGYFFAAGALLNKKITVKGMRSSAMQGDKKLLGVLSDMGAVIEETEEGISVCGQGILHGISVDMNDFSDQALTLAAIAPFCDGPVEICGIGHIRKQECDRIHAMAVNLAAMGVKFDERQDGIRIYPCRDLKEARIRTFNDHRVAMAFAVAGLKTGNITIENPMCCKKTFENYFTVLKELQ